MSQPPNGYICKICNIPGHWIKRCPSKYDPRLSQVPPDYICHKCGISGHWIQNCPNIRTQYENVTPPRQARLNDTLKKESSGNRSHFDGASNEQHGHVDATNMNYTHDDVKQHNDQKPNQHPPSNYICNKCGISGHWSQDCIFAIGQQQCQNVTPNLSDYKCNECGMKGHRTEDCLMFSFYIKIHLCIDCGIKGHFMSNCPLKHIENLNSLSEIELRKIAEKSNMDNESTEKFVAKCKEKQLEESRRIDNVINEYYEYIRNINGSHGHPK